MKKLLLLFFCILSVLAFNAQDSISYNPLPKDKLEISILTCTAGAELYSAFGHSAIRIKNRTKGTDYVFNFGTFNFNEPGFYTKFVRGKLNYFLSIEEYVHFEGGYEYEKRAIREQMLNLDYEQKIKLEKRLYQIYDSEERYYKYDFLYNNCSTKIYELLEETYGKSLNLPAMEESADETFMDYIHFYLKNSPWVKLGIDISLGLPCYKTPTARELSFLPEHLEANIDNATTNGESIVANKRTLLAGKKYNIPATNVPLIITASLLLLYLFAKRKQIRALSGMIYAPVFAFSAVVFLLVSFLWFFTDHDATQQNHNLIWLFPGVLTLPFISLIKKHKTIFTYIGLGIIGLSVILGFMNYINLALLPVIGILLFPMIEKKKGVRG